MSPSSLRVLGLVVVSAWLSLGCTNAEKKIEVGGTCILNSDCNQPLVCSMDKCHDACHASTDCPAGQSCVRTDKGTICQFPAEADCSQTTCAVGFTCASDLRCRSGCQSPADCAAKQECVNGVCADTTELTNGQLPQLTPDAGTDGPAVATGGAGGESGLGGESGTFGGAGGAGAAAAAGRDGGAGLGGAGGSAGGARDGAAAGGAGGGAGGGVAGGGAKDAPSGLGGVGGSSGGAAAGAGGTAIATDAGAPDAPADRAADTATVPDTKVTTSDTAATPDTGPPPQLDGGASTVLSGCGKVTTKRYFCDDFESGLDNWHYATEGWGLTDTTSQSATHSVTDSPNGNYPVGSKSEITMVNSVDLTGAESPIVTFWHKLTLGNSSTCCTTYYPDYTYVEVSSDGGNTWTTLTSFTNANNTSVWSFQQLPLSGYIGKKIKLRFRLLDNITSPAADGWNIDDVEIREAELAATAVPPQNPGPVEPTGCDGAPVAARYFCEDFETETDLTTKWQVATDGWNTLVATSQSPTHCVTDSPNGNYLSGAKSDMTMSSSVDLTSSLSPILTFWHKLSLGNSSTCCTTFYPDYTYVDVSSDSGTTWTVLASFTDANNTSVWSFQQLSLASYAGKKIRLRFRLVDNTTSPTADGWYLDDIKIRENEFVPAASDLALCTTQAAGAACNSADLCGKKCGPDSLGSKSLTCTAAKLVESVCAFPAGADYSCYKVGTVAACATGTKAGQTCNATACQACGATTGTGYLDASGAVKQGFCVCSKGVWSCGTTAEWPCYPQTTGATVPASCN